MYIYIERQTFHYFNQLMNGLQSLPTPYRGTSLIRNSLFLGPYTRPMPMTLRWSKGGTSTSS